MPFYFTLDGVDVRCDTLEELQQSAVAFQGRMTEPRSRRKKTGAARTGDKPIPRRNRRKFEGEPDFGKGPATLWAQAAYLGAKTKTEKFDARLVIAAWKRDEPRKFIDFEEEYRAFVKWYAKKGRISPPSIAEAALTELFDNDVTQYQALLAQFKKKK